MYVIENRNTKPQFNLALEEYLCRKSAREGSSFFMLWQNEPSIIIGRYQNTLEEINTTFVNERNIHVVRRNSGGGAVYHDLGNINYSFIMPDESGDFDFALFTQPIIDALASLGAQAELSGRNDITINGQKISGGAQYRRGGTILHHGTLLYSSDLDILTQALKVSSDKIQSKGVKSVRSRVTNIASALPIPVPLEDFRRNLQVLIKNLTEAELSPSEFDEIEALRAEKYSTWEWNYGHSPAFTDRKKMRFSWGGVEAFLNIQNGCIADCSFRGDFFGTGEYELILQRLTGIPYTRDAVQLALNNLDTHSIFAGSSQGDILALLLPDM